MAYDGTLKFDTSMDASGFQKDANKLGDVVKGLGVFKVIEKGFQAITASVDRAVSRYDTLNRFSPIMQQMGYSAESADSSIQKMSDGIQGLPTTLDDIVGSTQRLAIATGDLDKGTDSALALNNAFYASGATTEAASRGMEQYIQALSRNKMEMQEWKVLQETMPYALKKTAEAFGYVGTNSIPQLYNALTSGEITMTQFNDKLIELNAGVGGFAEVAKTATGGIGTAFTNMRTRIAVGVAAVIEGIDAGFSQTRFKSIENIISSTGNVIKSILTDMAGAFEFVASKADFLVPAIIAVGAATSTYKVATAAATVAAKAAGVALDGNITKAKLSAIITGLLTKSKTALTVATSSATAALAMLTASEGTAAQVGALLTVREAALAAVKGVLTGQIGLATAAQLVWNAALNANTVGLVITAVALLAAGITALIICLSKGSEAYDKQKEELKELNKAHEEYKEQLEADRSAADQAIAKTKGQAEANADLVDSLHTLIDANDAAGSNNEAIAQTVDQLNAAVEGLGLAYDATTGKLSASINEVERYVTAQGQLSVIQAQEEEYNRLLSEQLDLQAKIRVEEERKEILAQQLADGIIIRQEYNGLIIRTNNLLKEYGATESKLAADVEAAHAAIDRSAQDSAQAQVNAFEAINGARDAEGKNLKQLANQYGMTTDQILAEMREQGATMAEWSEKKAALFTEEGQSLQGVANQWGLTTDEVQAHMNEWGMNLDEFAQHMEDTHTKEGLSLDDLAVKWGTTTEAIKLEMDNMGLSMQQWSDQQQAAWKDYAEAVKDRTDGVVNSFKKIPGEYDQSAKDMLEILISNKARYAEWEAAMEEITRQLGPTAAAEFGKLGPKATSAMQEILGSADLLDQYREVFGVKIDEATGLAVENWNDPSFIGAPSTAIDSSAAQVAGNTSLDTAVTDAMEGAKAAADAVDFSVVGQNIATDIVNGLNGADMSGAMQGITDAVTNASGSVVEAAAGMSNGVQTVLGNMKAQSVGTTTQMMTEINSAVVSHASTVQASTTNMSTAIQIILRDLKAQAVTLSTQMMTEINSAIVTRTGTVRASASALSNGVVSGLSAMVSGAESVANRMMDGMLVVMNQKAESLYAKAREIANRIASIMADALDVHSPSRVMMRLFGNVMMGIYVAMDDMSGMLYRKAESIAHGLSERLTISPDVAGALTERMRAVTDHTRLGGSALASQPAYAGAGGGVRYIINLVQNITSPKPLSASEMTREGQDLLRRASWQLP